MVDIVNKNWLILSKTVNPGFNSIAVSRKQRGEDLKPLPPFAIIQESNIRD